MKFPHFLAVLALFLAGAGLAAAQGTLQTLFETGARSERINIVVLSEGYTSSQLNTEFQRDAAGLVEALLAREPYATFRHFFNAYAISVASNESGADYPADGTVRDTYFGASFGTNGLERLLTINSTGSSRAYALLNSLVPEYDIPLVLVNDLHYGGSGGALAVASVEQSASEVVIHEIGHSFGGLGDEYDYAGASPRETPNTTQTTDRALIRWRHWIDPATPIPTPETSAYDPFVGLFEGAAYNTTGWYRPTLNSLMQSLGQENRAVNEEALVLSMLELVPQIRSGQPAASSLTSFDAQPVTFRVSSLAPAATATGPITWYIDGVPAKGSSPQQPLIRRGEAWKYLASASAPPAGWNTAAFSDAAWSSGASPLGFGDPDVVTTVPGGPSNNRYPAVYFRRSFTVADPSAFTQLLLELRRDDGAVVHLNGVEIHRSNMASGAVSHTTLATALEGDAAENYWFDAVLPTAGLVAGTNVLAVEVHQSSLTSSDLKFDLALAGRLQAYPTTTLIAANATWKYRDTGVFPGATWTTVGFSDAAWNSGPAELGYGDSDEATTVGFGPSTSNRYITTWFRKTFTVANPAEFTSLDLSLIRDDGAVVYLNGQELARSNMGTGTVTPTTLATSADDDGETWQNFRKPATALVAGPNVVAVEVHQTAANSSDISFNLSLVGRREPAADVIVSRGSTWKYWDKGAVSPGWQATGFDEAGWLEGPAELGYGDGGEATTIGYGGNASSKYPTAYFRKTFDLPVAAPGTPLRLLLKYDDGAIVYLNGSEVVRANVGWGTVAYSALAGKDAPGDGSGFTAFEIPGSALRPGTNVLAVEIHQVAVTSSDLSFDLELAFTPDDFLTVNPASLTAGTHTVEARYREPSGKVLQDPEEFAVDQRQWSLTVSPPVDDDNDTLPDQWETTYLGTKARGADDDTDGDGQTNREELIAGTLPGSAASRFALTSSTLLPGGGLRIAWSSVPDRFYQIEKSTALTDGSWSPVYQAFGPPSPATTMQVDFSAPPAGQRVFYRVRVTQP